MTKLQPKERAIVLASMVAEPTLDGIEKLLNMTAGRALRSFNKRKAIIIGDRMFPEIKLCPECAAAWQRCVMHNPWPSDMAEAAIYQIYGLHVHGSHRMFTHDNGDREYLDLWCDQHRSFVEDYQRAVRY